MLGGGWVGGDGSRFQPGLALRSGKGLARDGSETGRSWTTSTKDKEKIP